MSENQTTSTLAILPLGFVPLIERKVFCDGELMYEGDSFIEATQWYNRLVEAGKKPKYEYKMIRPSIERVDVTNTKLVEQLLQELPLELQRIYRCILSGTKTEDGQLEEAAKLYPHYFKRVITKTN